MLTKPELLLLSGLPGSGKSTRAKERLAEDPNARIRINYDEMRIEDGRPFSFAVENEIKARARQTVLAAIDAGLSVVIDNTNLSARVREGWEQYGRSLGATVVSEEIDTSVDECVRRDKLREGKARVGRAVIERMALFNGFIDWADYVGNFVVVDVDGTLADCEHRRKHIIKHFKHTADCTLKCDCGNADDGAGHPVMCDERRSHEQGKCVKCGVKLAKDWPAFFRDCHLDPPIQPIIDLTKTLSTYHHILVVSGRPIDQCGKATEYWLDTYLPRTYDHLFMRNGGDGRPDTEVKQEILDHLPKDRIAYVIDDRPSVLRMWRANGLTTLAVGSGEEF